KSHTTQLVRNVRRVYVQQISDPVNSAHEILFRKHPPATQSTEAIHFCQPVRDDELPAKLERSFGYVLEQQIQIYFIHQNTRANGSRNFPDVPQRMFDRTGATRIMEICQHDETRLRSERSLDGM